MQWVPEHRPAPESQIPGAEKVVWDPKELERRRDQAPPISQDKVPIGQELGEAL